MAEDGMVINFAAPTGTVWEPKAVFKGGRWKDRLTARKSVEYGAMKRRERAAALQGESPETNGGPQQHDSRRATAEHLESDRAVKRRRVDGDGSVQGPTNQQSRPARYAKDPPREVISSLFTYNPTASTKKENPADQAEDDPSQAVAPSNAPLTAEEETFTKIGLSRAIAQHLPGKMNITAPTAIQNKAVTQLLTDDTDAFIQAETGSGKTLAYLLPLVQRLLDLSSALKSKTGQKITRHSGLFAIVLAPTRELSRQIESVLEELLGCARWIVSGSVTGGEKKKSEKARLRKGINILVATPGRLIDHLSNTEVLDVSKVRWLVLDEGDRLMELGFEQDIQKLISTLNMRLKSTAATEGDVGPLLPAKRTTILCSATMKMDVQRLGDISLKDAAHFSSDGQDAAGTVNSADGPGNSFQAPSQLKQSFAVVPAKQRLVTLTAVLRRAFARKGSTMKTIVFMSCADSVDFHFYLLTKQPLEDGEEAKSSSSHDEGGETKPLQRKGAAIPQGTLLAETLTSQNSSSISNKDNPVTAYRLHGSLPQHVRTSTLQAFARSQTPGVLVCTDVASRGLDLPNIDLVIEYDPPFSRDEHLHRIGRTARAGRPGRAMIFLMPGCEEGYVEILSSGRRAGGAVTRHDAEELLRKGFTPTSGVVSKGDRQWEDAATDHQLEVERWVLDDARLLEMARRAYQSHIRAYATHVAAERVYFDIKQLHLGHLAKAFGLRDRPASIKVPGLRQGKEAVKKSRDKAGSGGTGKKTGKGDDEVEPISDAAEARRKMLKMSRSMGGASEFNIG